jgi:hypothetical protein
MNAASWWGEWGWLFYLGIMLLLFGGGLWRLVQGCRIGVAEAAGAVASTPEAMERLEMKRRMAMFDLDEKLEGQRLSSRVDRARKQLDDATPPRTEQALRERKPASLTLSDEQRVRLAERQLAASSRASGRESTRSFQVVVRPSTGGPLRLVCDVSAQHTVQHLMDLIELQLRDLSTGRRPGALPAGLEGWRLENAFPRVVLASWRDFDVSRGGDGFVAQSGVEPTDSSRAATTLEQLGLLRRCVLQLVPE